MDKLYANEAEKLRDEQQTAAFRPRMKVSCIGPEQGFSDYAAGELCKGYGRTLCRSFAEAVDLLGRGETDYAVLPVENSITGGIQPVLELLAASDVFVTEEYMLHIDRRVAMFEGTDVSEIETVYAHESALDECAAYLQANFPKASLVAVPAASDCLSYLGKRAACIVGAHARGDGVVLSPSNITDDKQNFTRFILVRRGGAEIVPSAMVFLCAVCAHKPGSLLGLLKIFRSYSLNLTRIESRPIKESFGEYRFFIEFAGDLSNSRVQKALSEARAYCAQFKLLGAYL